MLRNKVSNKRGRGKKVFWKKKIHLSYLQCRGRNRMAQLEKRKMLEHRSLGQVKGKRVTIKTCIYNLIEDSQHSYPQAEASGTSQSAPILQNFFFKMEFDLYFFHLGHS